MKKIFALGLLMFIFIAIFAILRTFSYESFVDTFAKYDPNDFFMLLYQWTTILILFFTALLGEYYLIQKTKSYFDKTLYIYFPIILTFLSMVVVVLWEVLIARFLSNDGLLLVFLFLVLMIVTVCTFVYGYIRLIILQASHKTAEKLFYFLDKHFIKIVQLFLLSYVVMIMAVTFDYITYGRYIKLSHESNAGACELQATKHNDISYCEFTRRRASCQIEFFDKQQKPKELNTSRELYNFFVKRQCNNLQEMEAREQCKKSLAESLVKLIILEVEKKIGPLPKGVIMKDFRFYPVESIEVRILYQDMKNPQKMKKAVNKKLREINSYMTLNERSSDLEILIPIEELLKEDTDFYDIFENDIYPILYGKKK